MKTMRVAMVSLLGVWGSSVISSACSSGSAAGDAPGTIQQAVTANCPPKLACSGVTNSVCLPECPDVTQAQCNLGVWPGGIIWYEWFQPVLPTSARHPTPAPDKQDILAAMARWEAVSAGTIHFREDLTMSHAVRLRFIASTDAAFGTGGPMSYATCSSVPYNPAQPDSSGCFVAHGGGKDGNVDHELGHGIGLNHTHIRNDRPHYLRLFGGVDHCGADWDTKRCDSATKTGTGSGPFDFQSIMEYAVTDPDITRWDKSAICAGQDCQECQTGPSTAFFHPTPADGSAVIELYTGWWTRYQPLAKDVGARKPLSNELAPGVFAAGSPAVGSWENGMLDVYVRGTNDRIYVKNRVDPTTWSDWNDLGGTLTSDPGAVSWGPNRSDVFARGSNGNIYKKTYDGTWHGWTSLGKPDGVTVDSAPAVTSWGPGRLDIFVRGSDDRLYQKTCSNNATCASDGGGWGPWTVRGTGTFWGTPAVDSRGTGLIDVFVHGKDHTLWGINYSNGWGSFYPLNNQGILFGNAASNQPCPDCSSPAATSRGANMIDIMIRGTDDRVWITSWTGQATWPGFNPIGGQLSASPATVTRRRTTDRIDLVTVMLDTGSQGEPSLWWKTYP